MGRDTKQQRFPFSQCSARLTRLSAVSNANSNYFLTRLDILRVSFGIWMISYSHSRIALKPLISNHLQIKYFNQKTVGCSVSYYQRMLGEQLLQLLNIRENSICQENSFEWHYGKRTSAFLHISSKLGMQYAET